MNNTDKILILWILSWVITIIILLIWYYNKRRTIIVPPPVIIPQQRPPQSGSTENTKDEEKILDPDCINGDIVCTAGYSPANKAIADRFGSYEALGVWDKVCIKDGAAIIPNPSENTNYNPSDAECSRNPLADVCMQYNNCPGGYRNVDQMRFYCTADDDGYFYPSKCMQYEILNEDSIKAGGPRYIDIALKSRGMKR